MRWKLVCCFWIWSWISLWKGRIILLTCSQWLNCEGRRSTWSSRRHIEGAFGRRHTTTNHGSQLRSRCWFYGGRKTGEPGEKPSKHGRDQELYSHEFQVFWESTRGYIPMWSPMREKTWQWRAWKDNFWLFIIAQKDLFIFKLTYHSIYLFTWLNVRLPAFKVVVSYSYIVSFWCIFSFLNLINYYNRLKKLNSETRQIESAS